MDALFTPPRLKDRRIAELLEIARRYCELIDTSGGGRPQWLREVAEVLPRLHAAMTSLHYDAPHAEHDHPVDLDARFELYFRLRNLLGERDAYCLEFDSAQDGADAMTGSLADDLTDIYCELKHGLRAFPAKPARTLETWFLGYDCHWGQHLVDAQRHLATLAAADRLG
ncbi:MAG: DUF5063 domain-containing protein [Chromatiaceae bacterium]|jgi:hypothetical protein